MSELDAVVPDWRSRETWACGPGPMLDACERHWESSGVPDRLHLERFSLPLAYAGEGGTVTFTRSGQVVSTVEADGATPLLDVGQQAGPTAPSYPPDRGVLRMAIADVKEYTHRTAHAVLQSIPAGLGRRHAHARPAKILDNMEIGHNVMHGQWEQPLRAGRCRVRDLCDRYGIPYTTGPLYRQYGQVLRTILRLTLPNDMTSKDSPPPPARLRKRRSDTERPGRRLELGHWSRQAS